MFTYPISNSGGGFSPGDTLLFDTFTDTDTVTLDNHTPDTLGGGITGYTDFWSGGPAYNEIISNQCIGGNGGTRNGIDTTVANHTIEGKVFGASGGTITGHIFRWVDASNFWVTLQDERYTTVRRYVGGSITYTTSWNSLIAGYREVYLKTVCDGDNIKVYVDTVLRKDITDSTHNTGTIAAMWMPISGGSSSYFDDLLITVTL